MNSINSQIRIDLWPSFRSIIILTTSRHAAILNAFHTPLQSPSSLRPLLFCISKPAYFLRLEPRRDPGPMHFCVPTVLPLTVLRRLLCTHKACTNIATLLTQYLSRTFIATNLLIRTPHARSFEDSSDVFILAIYGWCPTYQNPHINMSSFCRLHRASHPYKLTCPYTHVGVLAQRLQTITFSFPPSNYQFSNALLKCLTACAFHTRTHRTIAVIAIP